MITKAFLIN